METLQIRSYEPLATLRPFLIDITTVTVGAEAAACRVEQLPDGAITLLCRITGAGSPELFFLGARMTAVRKQTAPGLTFGLRVRLAPGEASAFLGIPARELTNEVVPVAELWAGRASRLRDVIDQAVTAQQRVDIVQAALLEQLTRHHEREPQSARMVRQAVQRIQTSAGRLRMDKLAADMRVSTRHLRRLFRECVGLAPKQFARIVRIQHAATLDRSRLGGARVALAAGFYDQAHFCREWRALTETTLSVDATAFHTSNGARPRPATSKC